MYRQKCKNVSLDNFGQSNSIVSSLHITKKPNYEIMKKKKKKKIIMVIGSKNKKEQVCIDSWTVEKQVRNA